MTSILTWRNLAKHLLAFFVSAICIGYFILIVPLALDIFNSPDNFRKPGLITFIVGMGLFMGLYYAWTTSLFVMIGVALGIWLRRREWWFCALWGALSTYASAMLFHDPGHKLGSLFPFAIAFSGALAGTIYWLVAVRQTNA